jgi:hypothetical protein
MAVAVTLKRLQSGPHRPALPSLLGDGLPERLRSTSIALLGIIAAVGLGIVGFALQVGFPLVASAPLPEGPVKPDAASERERKLPKEGPAKKAASRPRATPAASTVDAEAGALPASAGNSDPATAVAPPPANEGAVVVAGTAPAQTRPPRKHPVDRTPAAESPATAATPTAPPPVEPTATSSEVPEPAPEAVLEAPPSTHPGNGNAYGKGSGKGVGSTSGPPGHASNGHGQDDADE